VGHGAKPFAGGSCISFDGFEIRRALAAKFVM